MSRKTIKISKEFHHRLVNRDKYQGNGKHTGKMFRDQFLKDLSQKTWWNENNTIVLDFEGVTTVGPSWANEVFAFYTSIVDSKEEIFKKIIFENISDVKMETIEEEVGSGYDS